MDLGIREERYGSDDLRWLGSRTGTQDAMTVTLEVDKFSGDGDYIEAGMALKQNTSGKYEPVTSADDELAGFLLTSQPKRGTTQIAPMMWRGRIRVDRLPDGVFDVTTLTTVPGAFTFTKES